MKTTTYMESKELIKNLQAENEKLRNEVFLLQNSYDDLKNNSLETLLLLDELPLGEIILDKNARFIACNKQFADSLNYTQEELLEKDFGMLLAEGKDIHKQSFSIFKKNGRDIHLVWKMKKKGGGIITNVLYAKAKHDKDGNFVYGRGYFFDITDKVATLDALKKSENEKVLLLQSMTDCIAYYGKDLKLIWANDNAANILGKDMDDMIGKTCTSFCNKDNKFCSDCPFTKTVETKKRFQDEIYIHDNLQIAMVTHPVLDTDKSLIGLVQTVTDITEKKNLENRLSELTTFERRKIGQDIHDGLSQVLTGTSFMASALQADLERCKSSLAKDAEDIVYHLKNTTNMMRGLVQGLCPVSIDPEGFVNALKNLVDNMRTVYKIECDFVCNDDIAVLNYDVANHLFLIAQEAACNAAKHSGCSKISIKLILHNNFVKLIISDNGSGMDTDIVHTAGMGVKIIKVRAMAIKGQLSIKSNNGKGTMISVVIPESNLREPKEL